MKKLKTITILQSILIIILVLLVAVLLLVRKAKSNQIQTSLNVPEIPNSVDDEFIYETTGEKIYINDPKTGRSWVPVLADVPACQYQSDQYVTRNNLTYYTENNKIISKFGVDVSEHDGEIDWQTVKSAGVDFAFIRVGYRGYSEGKIVPDIYYEKNLQGALENHIDVGLYFYSQAVTPEEALEEAEFLLASIGENAIITYPIVYDWEFVTTDTARTDNISTKTLTECTVAFCERIKQAGYTPMIYQNKSTSLLNLNLPELTDYDFWLAEYNNIPTYYYNYQIWQYSESGTVPGIKNEVDVNICFKDYTNPEKKESDENA